MGIPLKYVTTIVDRKVMGTLLKLETTYPDAGAALVSELFPGHIRPREEAIWAYATRRSAALKKMNKDHQEASKNGREVPKPWGWQEMPPHESPVGDFVDISDIPEAGEYKSAS